MVFKLRLSFVLATGVILFSGVATAAGPAGLLDGMISAWESGRASDMSYFAGTSADTPANYLLALAWGGKALAADRVHRDAAALFRTLQSDEIHAGDCIGWGIGAPLDAFSDGSVNPADTIYLYTTARVAIALLQAEKAHLVVLDRHLLDGVSCTLRTLFDFDPAVPRLHYSNNPNDARYVVYNVFADLARAEILLGERLHDPRLFNMARAACEVLQKRQRPDGSLPYFEGGQDNDAVHHAMVLIGLYKCAAAFAGTYAPAVLAARLLVEHFLGMNGETIDSLPNLGWALGESLVGLQLVCARDHRYCRYLPVIGRYIVSHDKDGMVGNKNPRFQSWLAAGVAYAGERALTRPPDPAAVAASYLQ